MSYADRKLGDEGEAKALPILQAHFGPDLLRVSTRDRYALFDYSTEGSGSGEPPLFVELKTRRISKDTYPTTIVPIKKIQHAAGQIRRATTTGAPIPRFAFAFQFVDDGVWYIEYPFNYKVEFVTRRDSKTGKGKPHAHIDTKDLRPCCDGGISRVLDLAEGIERDLEEVTINLERAALSADSIPASKGKAECPPPGIASDSSETSVPTTTSESSTSASITPTA